MMGKLDGAGVLAANAVVTGQPPASSPAVHPPQLASAAATEAATGSNTQVAADASSLSAGAVEASVEQTAASPTPLVVVLYGPPVAGTSTQASSLSRRYSIPVLAVDQLLQEAYRLQQAKTAEAAAAAVATGAAAPAENPQQHQLAEQLSKLLFAAPELNTAPASPTARAQSASKRPGTAAGAHADPQQHHSPSVPEVVAAAFRVALQQEQYSQGYIVDGLNSKHLPSAAVVARCLMQAVGLSCKALQPPEPPAPPLSASAKAVKAPSRPASSRPGAKGAAAPEPVPPIMTFAGPDVWEGTQQVRSCVLGKCHIQGHVEGQLFALFSSKGCRSEQQATCSAASLSALTPLAAQVHVVELKMSREEAVRRHEAAAAAAALGLEVADLGAEASRGLLEEASFMPQQLLLPTGEQVRFTAVASFALRC